MSMEDRNELINKRSHIVRSILECRTFCIVPSQQEIAIRLGDTMYMIQPNVDRNQLQNIVVRWLLENLEAITQIMGMSTSWYVSFKKLEDAVFIGEHAFEELISECREFDLITNRTRINPNIVV